MYSFPSHPVSDLQYTYKIKKSLKSHFLSHQAVLKISRLSRDALGRMLDGAGQLVAVSRIPLSIWLALVFVLSQMDRSLQGVLKKCNRPNARQRRHRRVARSSVEEIAFCAPLRVNICVESLQERLGLTTKDADFSSV